MQAYLTFTLSTSPETEIAKVNFEPNSKLLKICQKFQNYRNIELQQIKTTYGDVPFLESNIYGLTTANNWHERISYIAAKILAPLTVQ